MKSGKNFKDKQVHRISMERCLCLKHATGFVTLHTLEEVWPKILAKGFQGSDYYSLHCLFLIPSLCKNRIFSIKLGIADSHPWVDQSKCPD